MVNSIQKRENKIILYGIIIYWTFFWLLNVVDKFIEREAYLWIGKDRFAQFINYFSSIGIENTKVAYTFLVIVTILEIAAFVFALIALSFLILNEIKKAHSFFFMSILSSLIIFSFFAIGDQIFGDRVELLEHTIYWITLVLSWYIYTKEEEKVV